MTREEAGIRSQMARSITAERAGADWLNLGEIGTKINHYLSRYWFFRRVVD